MKKVQQYLQRGKRHQSKGKPPVDAGKPNVGKRGRGNLQNGNPKQRLPQQPNLAPPKRERQLKEEGKQPRERKEK